MLDKKTDYRLQISSRCFKDGKLLLKVERVTERTKGSGRGGGLTLLAPNTPFTSNCKNRKVLQLPLGL